MGLAARAIWINQGIRRGNVIESQKLRGRETVLEDLTINCKDMRMLSARTGDKLRAISEVARKGRRVKDLRRLLNHPDLWMQAYLNIQGNKGALTRGTDSTTMDGYSPERAANLVELIREKRYKPNPVRRVNIPTKVAGKMRPLGIPNLAKTSFPSVRKYPTVFRTRGLPRNKLGRDGRQTAHHL